MFPGGHCPDVGLGGFLLQGGMGWNCRVRKPSYTVIDGAAFADLDLQNWGWACEYVIGIDVITSCGEIVRADSEQNTDLLWAARGAGPGFPGLVTRFHLQTKPLPKVMKSSLYIYKLSQYQAVFDWALKVRDNQLLYSYPNNSLCNKSTLHFLH